MHRSDTLSDQRNGPGPFKDHCGTTAGPYWRGVQCDRSGKRQRVRTRPVPRPVTVGDETSDVGSDPRPTGGPPPRPAPPPPPPPSCTPARLPYTAHETAWEPAPRLAAGGYRLASTANPLQCQVPRDQGEVPFVVQSVSIIQ